MNLKLRMAMLFTALVAVLVLLSSAFIYLFYADFRKDEFYLRLEQKALTTYRLLADVKAIDNELLQYIDKNTLNELNHERILIFDTTFRMIYSNMDDQKVSYSTTLLTQTMREGKLQLNNEEEEMLCLYIHEGGNKAIIVASAYDKYGRRKLENLKLILISVAVGSLVLSSVLSYFYVQQVFKPIHQLNFQIRNISETNLNERVPVKRQQDELADLAMDFNHMLDRIENAFRFQKNFIQHASHELRTPLATLIAQTEAALAQSYTPDQYRNLVLSLNEDHKNLSALVDALLLLSKYESLGKLTFNKHRVDEILDKTIDEIKIYYPKYQVKLDYKNVLLDESGLEIECSEVLLRSAFSNLIRNACTYSTDMFVEIMINVTPQGMFITFRNDGEPISEEDQKHIFTPFFRAANASTKRGFGLGLSIVRRIAELHHASIVYTYTEDHFNQFEFSLPKLF